MSFLLPCGGIMNNIDLLKTITNYKKIKNPAYPAQESLLIHLYIRVNDKIQSIIENELSEYRINTSTFMVLVSLYTSDDYCQSPSDIYKELQFSKTNITHIIDKLEKKNIAKRINNENDRRSKSICLTPDGVTLAQKLINTQNVMLKKIWSGLSDDEMKTFELANKKLLSNLNVN
ncbi:MarR family transcriptional regulator [Escherichia coli]|nr:MarR family transcriptional regulator [Escherichia coli]